VRPFAACNWLTPIIAVAGSVADEIIATMTDAPDDPDRVVNGGGDIALHLAPGGAFTIAVVSPAGDDLGRIRFHQRDGIHVIATIGVGSGVNE